MSKKENIIKQIDLHRVKHEEVKKIIEDYKYLKSSDFLIIVSLIGMSFALIFYQLMTINAKFIFLIIPILVGFSHIYYKKYFKQKNSIIFLLIFFSIIVFNYFYSFL